MIEISHPHARRLLRQEVDGRLPEEQWSVLQAHLESCAECRAYRARLARQGQSLRRALRGGWEPVSGPGVGMAQAVMAARRKALLRQQVLIRAALAMGAAALLALLFFAAGGTAGITQGLARIINGEDLRAGAGGPVEEAPFPLVTEFPQPTPLPTAAAGEFPGLVIYEARRGGRPEGDSELYLLNPGAAPLVISSHPAEDTQPAWSPDGEWIAFLSDRAGSQSPEVGEKFELYVTDLASGRLVQLTAEPGVEWQGPLSWARDGRSIALTGIRTAQGSQRWVYLVPLDGTGPRALTGTRGAWSPKFSRSGERLAYNISDGDFAGVEILNLPSGERVSSRRWAENRLAARPANGAAFDWSLDGSALAYIGASPPALAGQGGGDAGAGKAGAGEAGAGDAGAESSGSEVVALRDLNYPLSLFSDFRQVVRVANSSWPSAYRAVSWAPNGWVLFLEDQNDARARLGPMDVPGECWRIQARPPREGGGGYTVGGLCVEGGLDNTSWTPDNRWLVLLGRMQGESRRGIYAVNFTGASGGGGAIPGERNNLPSSSDFRPGTILRLADEPFTGTQPRVRPRLRPFEAQLNIHPRPAAVLRDERAPSDLSARPDGPTGRLVYVVKNNNISVVVATDPNGMGGRVLHASSAEARCPRWSADGSQVALLLRPPAEAAAGVENGSTQAVDAPVGGVGIGGGSDLMLWPYFDELPPPNVAPPPSAALWLLENERADLTDSAPTSAGSGGAASAQTGWEELYVLDATRASTIDGAPADRVPRRISDRSRLPESGPEPVEVSYGCPVWSPADAPNGPYLAVQISTGRAHYLAVIPAGGGPARYVTTGAPVAGAGPTWSPDGRSLYLAQLPPRGETVPRLMTVRLPEDPAGALFTQSLPINADWNKINGLAVSPDSAFLAVLTMSSSEYNTAMVFLRQLDLSESSGPAGFGGTLRERGPLMIGMSYNRGTARPSRLAWLPGGSLGMVLHNDPLWRNKAYLSYYDASRSEVITLAAVEDALGELAWSPDGRWLVYSTESGLWGLDVLAARAQQAAPVWLSPVPVQDLDWK